MQSILTDYEQEFVQSVHEHFSNVEHTKFYCFFIDDQRTAVRVANELRKQSFQVQTRSTGIFYELTVNQ